MRHGNVSVSVINWTATLFLLGCANFTTMGKKSFSDLDAAKLPKPTDRPPMKTVPGFDSVCGETTYDPESALQDYELRTRLLSTRVWVNPEDPNDKVTYHPCLNSERRRALSAVPSADAVKRGLPELRAGYKRYANVLHEGKFWFADLPASEPSAISNIYFQLEPFPTQFEGIPGLPEVAHAQVRVEFAEPIRIYPILESNGTALAPDSKNTKESSGQSLKNLILTVESVGAKTDGFDLIGGQMRNFAIVYGVRSTKDRYQEIRGTNTLYNRKEKLFGTPAERKAMVREYLLKFNSDSERLDFFKEYVKQSQRNFALLIGLVPSKEQENLFVQPTNESEKLKSIENATYQTLSRNCTTAWLEIFAAVYKTSDIGEQICNFFNPLARASEFFSFVPAITPNHLQTMKFIDKTVAPTEVYLSGSYLKSMVP